MAAALAEAQRIAAFGLRATVQLGRDEGLSRRDSAKAINIPASTLYRQFREGTDVGAPLIGTRRPELTAYALTGELPVEQNSAGLTPREHAVAFLLTRGFTNREISLTLSISERTASQMFNGDASAGLPAGIAERSFV